VQCAKPLLAVRKDPNIGLATRLTKVIVDRSVRIPEGLVGGEDPSLDAQRFRRIDKGVCLITQRMIGKLSS
jgi:glucose-1-phosphate adenylyltransferase